MINDIPNLIEEIKRNIKEFTDIAIIGLSGGADSTLVAILCMLALEKDNVYGISMPANSIDIENANKKSINFADYIGINNINTFIQPLVDMSDSKVICSLPDITEIDKLCKGNITARLRMTLLYAFCETISKQKNMICRVIGTGNLCEDIIGYATKFGDLGVDINIIGDLYKSEVYQLLNYFKKIKIITEDHINRTPTAGLWEGQTDEKELGYTYDKIEYGIRNFTNKSNEITTFVKNKYKENKHKIEEIPNINLRKYCD